MKLYIILAAVLSQSVFSKCPNACNGHGECNIHDQCACFTEDSAGFIYLSSDETAGGVCFALKTGTLCAAEAAKAEGATPCKWDAFGTAEGEVPKDTDGLCKLVVKDDSAFHKSKRYGSSAHPEWTGADCSRRTCPRSTSWTEVGDNFVDDEGVTQSYSCTHKPEVECSDQGLCDRATGLCECFPGYTGSACQRTECPDDCAGHGTCRSNRDFAYDFAIAKTHQMLRSHHSTERFKENYVVTYDNAWDTNHLYGCLCDRGYRGPSCTQVECPSSNDPLDDKCDLHNKYAEVLGLNPKTDHENSLFVENFQIQKFAATGSGGWQAAYTTSTAAEQSADVCNIAVNIADNTGALCNAVTGPHSEKCIFTAGTPNSCVQDGNWLSEAPGDKNSHFYNGKVYACFGAMSGMDCSGRGICDYSNGQCKCFSGYSGTACNIIEELS